jgi:hypothetical protein
MSFVVRAASARDSRLGFNSFSHGCLPTARADPYRGPNLPKLGRTTPKPETIPMSSRHIRAIGVCTLRPKWFW